MVGMSAQKHISNHRHRFAWNRIQAISLYYYVSTAAHLLSEPFRRHVIKIIIIIIHSLFRQ